MFDKLKQIALQRLMSKMAGNSLGDAATGEAANEGVAALLNSLKGGDISQITALLGGGAGAGENEALSGLKGKLGEILQAKGMSAEEATAESESTAQDLVAGLKEKFQSDSEEDKDFDLSALTGLLGGDAGGMLGKAGGILGAAKNILGK